MENKTYKFGKLEYATNDPSDLINLDEPSIIPEHKTVLIFPGNQTSHTAEAGRYAKFVEYWLENSGNTKNVDIVAVSYPNGKLLLSSGEPNYQAYNFREYAHDLLLPYFAKDGKRLSMEEALQNVNNLTIFAHSAGALVMNDSLAFLRQEMASIGYSQKEIDKLYSNIVFVAYAPYMMVNEQVKAIYVCPLYDSVGSFVKGFKFISEKENVKTSGDFKIKKFLNIYEQDRPRAKEYCLSVLGEHKAICATNQTNTLVVAPNLLFEQFGDLPEDHNLAGIIKYPFVHPSKTIAGKQTTKIMSIILKQACLTPRADFDINNVYQNCVNIYKNSPEREA